MFNFFFFLSAPLTENTPKPSQYRPQKIFVPNSTKNFLGRPFIRTTKPNFHLIFPERCHLNPFIVGYTFRAELFLTLCVHHRKQNKEQRMIKGTKLIYINLYWPNGLKMSC